MGRVLEFSAHSPPVLEEAWVERVNHQFCLWNETSINTLVPPEEHPRVLRRTAFPVVLSVRGCFLPIDLKDNEILLSSCIFICVSTCGHVGKGQRYCSLGDVHLVFWDADLEQNPDLADLSRLADQWAWIYLSLLPTDPSMWHTWF